MLYRTVVIAVVACLLSACSAGDATDESQPAGGEATAAVSDADAAERAAAGDNATGPGASGGETPGTGADGVRPDQAQPGEPGGDAVSTDEGPDEPAEETEQPGEVEEETRPGGVESAYGLRVLRAYVCRGIERSEPTEAGKSFVPQDGVLTLCCFSEIAGAEGPERVFHLWRWGDREMARVELEVKGSRWRTWSTKKILDEWRGEWHVDVTDRDGTVLTTLDFSVE